MIVNINNCGLKAVIDLKALCESENEYWSDKVYGGYNHKRKGFKTYPVNKAKKMFKFILENIYDDSQLDDIQAYLDEHTKTFKNEFRKLREKL